MKIGKIFQKSVTKPRSNTIYKCNRLHSMEKRNETIRQVVEEYGDTIYRLALHYVKSPADAEDVVQEVLLAFFTREIPEERRKAWLLRVTVNKSLDVLRKQRKHAPLDESIPDERGEKTGLAEELKELSPLDREIIYLFYFEGYTSKEIARLVRKTDGAVRKRLERAKKTLRQILENES